MSMWLDLDPTRGMAMSEGRGSFDYKIPSLACAKGMTALGRKLDMHLTWYSSNHKKEDSDFLRSAAVGTPLIGWVHVRLLQRHVYHLQYSWCTSHCPRVVPQAVAESPTHMPQCHVSAFSLLQSPNSTPNVKRSKNKKMMTWHLYLYLAIFLKL